MKAMAVLSRMEVLLALNVLPTKRLRKNGNKALKERTSINTMKNKKLITFTAILFCVIIICSACSTTGKVSEQVVKNCEDFGLENVTVDLSRYKTYGHNFYRAKIKCDGFASLDSKSAADFFDHVRSIDSDIQFLSEKDISVYSDSKVYTAEKKKINGYYTVVVYVDSKAMEQKYDDSNRKECGLCDGLGSKKCTKCNGTGKIGMRTFDGWGDVCYFKL